MVSAMHKIYSVVKLNKYARASLKNLCRSSLVSLKRAYILCMLLQNVTFFQSDIKI